MRGAGYIGYTLDNTHLPEERGGMEGNTKKGKIRLIKPEDNTLGLLKG